MKVQETKGNSRKIHCKQWYELPCPKNPAKACLLDAWLILTNKNYTGRHSMQASYARQNKQNDIDYEPLKEYQAQIVHIAFSCYLLH